MVHGTLGVCGSRDFEGCGSWDFEGLWFILFLLGLEGKEVTDAKRVLLFNAVVSSSFACVKG